MKDLARGDLSASVTCSELRFPPPAPSYASVCRSASRRGRGGSARLRNGRESPAGLELVRVPAPSDVPPVDADGSALSRRFDRNRPRSAPGSARRPAFRIRRGRDARSGLARVSLPKTGGPGPLSSVSQLTGHRGTRRFERAGGGQRATKGGRRPTRRGNRAPQPECAKLGCLHGGRPAFASESAGAACAREGSWYRHSTVGKSMAKPPANSEILRAVRGRAPRVSPGPTAITSMPAIGAICGEGSVGIDGGRCARQLRNCVRRASDPVEHAIPLALGLLGNSWRRPGRAPLPGVIQRGHRDSHKRFRTRPTGTAT
jgi:hypothetical protein